MASRRRRRPPPCPCRRSRCRLSPIRLGAIFTRLSAVAMAKPPFCFCYPQPLGTVALIILLVFGRQPAAGMARVAALVGPTHIGDHRLLTLELHLERGHQGVFRVDDDVV